MSLIKDFESLHFGTKGTILNIASTIPFFFIIIYLFSNTLIFRIEGNPFSDLDFYFVLALCFCLSLLWFCMNFMLSIIIMNFVEFLESKRILVDPTKKVEEPNDPDTPIDELVKAQNAEDSIQASFITTYIYSVGYISIAIFINRWLDLPLQWFILSCFGFILFRFAWVYSWHLGFKIITRRRERKGKK